MRFHGYQKVSPEDGLDSNMRKKPTITDRIAQLFLSPLPWVFTTFVLLIMVVVLFSQNDSVTTYDYARGFNTEYGPARASIEVVKLRFSGSLRYHDDGTLYVDYAKDEPRFFGTPSEDIDHAWENLIGPRLGVRVPDNQVQDFQPPPFEDPITGLLVGPDVLHSLHCVNNIRMLFDSEYYFNKTKSELQKVHRLHFEHCLNHIRQLIQCHMDITPITPEYVESVNTVVSNFDQQHTCRDISKLREWIAEEWLHAESIGLKEPVTETAGLVLKHGYVLNEDGKLPWSEADERN